jgi:D-glycero-D-manno-heptose 1,7-bisphosphate phosphatase
MVKAVFLDRDGTINKLIKGRENPKHVGPWYYSEFDYIDGVEDAIYKIKRLGYTTHVVTNQPDVNDGYMTKETLDVMNQAMKKDLKVDTISCAMERNTPDYKPNNGMIEKVIKEFKVTRERSWMIGDSWKDIVAGKKSGLKTIYVGGIWDPPEEYKYIAPDYDAENLLESSKIIEQNEGGK